MQNLQPTMTNDYLPVSFQKNASGIFGVLVIL